MVYVFRIMTCEAYYETHPPPGPDVKDRCSIHEVEAGTARALALLGASTTLFGLMNLMVCHWTIKRLGIKFALVIQVFWAAARLAVQNVGVMTGGNTGILITQCSQIITILGGPNGYVLTLNSFITDVVGHEERTGALGRLQGCMLVGAATGFLIGGLVAGAFGILAPFRITLALFLLCCCYILVALPSIPSQDDAATQKSSGLIRFFGPLHIFKPQKWILKDGGTSTEFGALTLGVGVFLAILATGYLPTLLQLYSTNEFGFGTSENGWLIFIYSSLRGLYLTLVFPRFISTGRKWMQPKKDYRRSTSSSKPQDEAPLLEEILTSPNEIGPIDTMDNDTESTKPPPRTDEDETFAFDLMYARCSLLADGVFTGLAMLVSEGWQLYLVACYLPLAAGTGSASKGAILQMLPREQRLDALSGISLVENVARLMTTAVFGLIFAGLAEVGRSWLTFACNSAIALIGFVALCLSRFPRDGSKRAE